MAQQEFAKAPVERRCPNCGTRVAVEAESCFMCGYDLRIPIRRKRRVSIIDLLLVIAVFAVLAFWWQLGRNQNAEADAIEKAAILPEQIPAFQATETLTPTLAATPTSLSIAPAKSQTQTIERAHVVQSGETLDSIARQYRVTVEDVQRANSLSTILIRPGDRLTVPVSIQVLAASGDGTGTSSGEFLYTVRAGDTVANIAARTGSSVDQILATNNLATNDVIRPGDTLRVPVQAVPLEVFNNSPAEAGNGAQPGQITAPAGELLDTRPVPNLTSPPDESVIDRNEAVPLRWTSVDVLPPNEWYVVQIYAAGGSARVFPTVWTKSTSHRINPEFAPVLGDSATYSWQVIVVRVQTGVDGSRALEAVSPASELRKFTWQ